MKRYGNLYEQICSMDNLRKAHQNAKKGKGWYQEVKEVEADVEGYLTKLQEMLVNHTYHTSNYEKFIKRENEKEREIFKLPYFPDRICQWAILQVIEPYLIRNLTKNTYSAIPKRGIHAALHDTKEAMQKDVPNCQFCLKLDVRHYYPSINHDILKAKFRRLFKDADLLWLLDEIIDSICTAKIEDMRDIWFLDEDADPETGNTNRELSFPILRKLLSFGVRSLDQGRKAGETLFPVYGRYSNFRGQQGKTSPLIQRD